MPNISQRICRIEKNLLPQDLDRNEYVSKITLPERMQHYKTPGVSIAAIDNGEIEWTQGYGVCEQDSNISITKTTLFQAASISKPIAAMAALSLVQNDRGVRQKAEGRRQRAEESKTEILHLSCN